MGGKLQKTISDRQQPIDIVPLRDNVRILTLSLWSHDPRMLVFAYGTVSLVCEVELGSVAGGWDFHEESELQWDFRY